MGASSILCAKLIRRPSLVTRSKYDKMNIVTFPLCDITPEVRRELVQPL